MAIKLNRRGFEHAKTLIQAGEVLRDDRGMLTAHIPRTKDENELIRDRGIDEYASWYLGLDDSKGAQNRSRYRFPIGDFERVHRCAVMQAESKAVEYDDPELLRAAIELRRMVDAAETGETIPQRRAA
jgi:hypothetical protein